MSVRLNRRVFLNGLLGCSVAASPLVTPITLASAPWETRLVVIILRGGMDGLDVIQPYGDPDFAALRRNLAGGPENGAIDLDGFYALHPGFASIKPLWDAGEVAFVHAASTPYRDRRSHFDGQDLLEAGTGMDVPRANRTDGWLNRLLQDVPGVRAETAYGIGVDEMLITRGDAEASRWSPDADLRLSPQAQRLLELVYHDDPLFRDAAVEAIDITQALAEAPELEPVETPMMDGMVPARRGGGTRVAEFAAARLRGDTRIAAFSVNGWDMHARQGKAMGRRLAGLADVLTVLRTDLGAEIWGKTAVLAMTEFGRTARENGSQGTDHGTAGAMVLAGGAVRGSRVYGDWPGLGESALYQGRDLMPTRDVRAYAGWVMRALFGVGTSRIERTIFPGVDLGSDPGVIL